MEFGWAAKVLWVVVLVGVLGAVLYAKRKPPPGA
jgi:hypothetical protein